MAQPTRGAPGVYELGHDNYPPVKANEKVFEGAILGLSGGHVRQLQAGDPFAGMALEDAAGGPTDGAARVKARERGKRKMPVQGATPADAGKPVFATDGGTLALAGQSYVGTLLYHDLDGVPIVRFRAFDAPPAG